MRKTTLTLITIFLLSCDLLQAQAPAIEWQKCYGGGYLDDPSYIETTSDGGYIMIGSTYGPGGDVAGFHGNTQIPDYWVVKLDNAGVIQWARCLGGTSVDLGTVVHQAPDGGYVVAGESGSLDGDGDVTVANHGGLDYWIVKLSSTGAIQWQQSVGGEKNEYLYGMQFTPDGGYILAGETESTGGQVSGNHGGRDFWIVKLSSTGSLEWQKCVGGSQDEEAYGIQVMPDGTYIAVGYTNSNDGDVIGNHGQSDVFLVRLSPTGSLLWTKCLGGSNRDEGWDLQKTTDGGLILAGYTGSNDGDVSGNHVAYPGTWDFWVVKLDITGTLQWQKCYGGSDNEIAYSIANAPDGGYVVAGSTGSTDGDVTCLASPEQDAWVIKISSTGALQWEKTLGGKEFGEAHCVSPTPDGGNAVLIYTASPELPGYHPDVSSTVGDFYVVKLSAAVSTGGAPTVTITTPPADICQGATLTLETSGTNLGAGVIYQWTRDGLSVGTNAPTYTASNFGNGDQVFCTVTASGVCDVNAAATSNTIILNVSNIVQPTIQITPNEQSVCAGSVLTFTASVTNGNTLPDYQWEVNGGPAGADNPIFSSSTLQNGDIVSCVYSDNTACVVPGPNTSNAVTALVLPLVIPSVSIDASATEICAGSAITFTATPVNGGPAPGYQWLLNGAGVGVNSPVYSNSSLANGDVVRCVLSSNAVCSTPGTASSNNIPLKVNAVTPTSIGIGYAPATICSGKPVVFTADATGQGPAPIYQWQVNGINVGVNGATYTSDTLSNGDNVTCLLSDTVGCIASSSGNISLTVDPTPTVYTGKSASIQKGQSLVLDISLPANIATYLWTPATGLSDSTIANPVASPLVSTTYTLTATSAEGCTASGEFTLWIFSKLSIPNAFTPNGDGHNDIFYVMGGPLGSRIKDFAVFNRWGARVFQVHDVATDDPAFGWNGMVNGSDAPTGAYIYEILMGFADGSQQVYKGTVMLVR